MQCTSSAKVHASRYSQSSGNQHYIVPHPGRWVRNALVKITSAFSGPSKPAGCLPQHSTTSPLLICSTSSNNPPQKRLLHLLACIHRNRFRKVLQQDRVEDVLTDRALLRFLKKQYLRHRGKLLYVVCLKSVKGIFFVRFHLPIGGSVDVRHHNPCCVTKPARPLSCECIPPLPKVEPSPGAEYQCIPGTPATYPPIPLEYLSSLFTCPIDVHEQDTWILDQVPKHTCGELQDK